MRPKMLVRQNLVKHGYTDTVTDIIFFIVCKIYFLLVVHSKGKINTLKRYYVSHGTRSRCKFHFRYVTVKILLTLQVYFPRRVSLKFSEHFSQF